jgi:hypothetical protein
MFSVRIPSSFLISIVNAELHSYCNSQGQSIQVIVEDLCPGCQGANGIDLSEGAIAALDLNYPNDGVISVVWCFA